MRARTGDGNDVQEEKPGPAMEKREREMARRAGVVEDADEDMDVEMAAPDDAAEEISIAEVHNRLRDIARGKEEHQEHDPEDVSWVDQDPDEGATALHMRVRMATSAPNKAPPPAQSIPVDADMDVLSLHRIHADEQNDPTYAQRMKRWANDEGCKQPAPPLRNRQRCRGRCGRHGSSPYTRHYRRQVDETAASKEGRSKRRLHLCARRRVRCRLLRTGVLGSAPEAFLFCFGWSVLWKLQHWPRSWVQWPPLL
ncbi:hypothetical protein H4582DRAFT_96882 [Lactarius indigo]|nr:hypothetical protein H4582DRAFT_96882 [Lactarius indigo]